MSYKSLVTSVAVAAAVVAMSGPVSAETIVFSGKGASAFLGGRFENSGRIQIDVFSKVSRDGSSKYNTPGANLVAEYYAERENGLYDYYWAAVFTTDVKVYATGKRVVASGTIPFTWDKSSCDENGDNCDDTEIPCNVVFDMDVKAMTDGAVHYWGIDHYATNTGSDKAYHHKYDEMQRAGSYNNSSIIIKCSIFDEPITADLDWARVGTSKYHDFSIERQ